MLTSPLLVYLVSGCIGALSRWAEPRALRGELSSLACLPVGKVQQLHDVDDAAAHPVAAKAGLKLGHAARVGGGDQLRAGGGYGLHLAVQQRQGHLAVRQRVDAGAAAAAVRLDRKSVV